MNAASSIDDIVARFAGHRDLRTQLLMRDLLVTLVGLAQAEARAGADERASGQVTH